jgi:predicted DNA-binding protein with PD1-like motif
MKKTGLVFALILVCTLIQAQDKKLNIQSVTTRFERIELISMKPGTDMLEGINQVIKDKHIKNAVILTGIGSVTDYHYHVVVDKKLPPSEEFPKASVAMDVVSVQGLIMNGRVHAHIALSDENSMVGGHLELGTKALTFFIITIGILPDDLEIINFDSYKL